jgi:hypothetical protein
MAEIDDIFASKEIPKAVISIASASIPPQQRKKTANQKRKRVAESTISTQSDTRPAAEIVIDSSASLTRAKRPRVVQAAKDAVPMKHPISVRKKMDHDTETKFQDSRGSESRQSSISLFYSFSLNILTKVVKRRKVGPFTKKTNWAYMTREVVSRSITFTPFRHLIY